MFWADLGVVADEVGFDEGVGGGGVDADVDVDVGAGVGVGAGGGFGVGGGSVFDAGVLLSVERLVLFERQGVLLAECLEDELGRWLGDAVVSCGVVSQVDGFEGGGFEGCDLAVVRQVFGSGFGVVGCELGLALAVVSALCGGPGGGVGEVRALSRLEVGVLDLVLAPLVGLMVGLFDLGGCELGEHVSGVSGLPEGKREPVVVFPFRVEVAGVEGGLTVGLSGSQLQSFLEGVDRRIAGQAGVGGGPPCGEIVRAVQPVCVELVAGFDVLRVPAQELVGLRVGDVIRTRQSVGRPLVARVGEERLFHFRPGAQGQRLVAEVTGHVVSGHVVQPVQGGLGSGSVGGRS